MAPRFDILDSNTRQYKLYNYVGSHTTARLIPPSDETHYLASVNDLFEHVLRDVGDSDMVGIMIQNHVNQNDRPIGISFRRKDQLSADLIWSVFEKLSESNSRFETLDTLVVTVHSVRIPVGFGKRAIKSRGRPISVMAHLKSSIVEVKAEKNCLAHALVISITRWKMILIIRCIEKTGRYVK